MEMIKCEAVFGGAVWDFDGKNPIGALADELAENEDINEELKRILTEDEEAVTTEYLVGRFDRFMSPLFNRVLSHNDGSLSQTSAKIADILISKYLNSWSKLADAMFADYNPIDNYNMVENRETDLTEETTTGSETTTKNKFSGFNSTEMAEVSEVDSDADIGTTKTETGAKAKNETVRRGNIGVTTSQQMIESEYALRRKNLLDAVYSDIDSVLFMSYYG